MSSRASSRSLLIISQVYVPDSASVGQHMHDAAVEMARRGWNVTVLTSARGYEDPSLKFPVRETRDGVRVIRLPLSSFGKKSIPIRLLGQAIFLALCTLRGLLLRHDAILVSTSPPMASVAALTIHSVRGKPIRFWAMDINPDQAVAMGTVKQGSLAVRLFDRLNHRFLGAASNVVALDRFMAERLKRKAPLAAKIVVMPPWPHDDHLTPVPHDQNPFRVRHDLRDKIVFMYSGNMSIASPLTTLLKATLAVRDDPRIHFVFVGGGLGKREVESIIREQKASNVTCLPYQPLSELRYSLSAADVHLITLGNAMVGIVHPCKVYGAMAVARPVLFVGPKPSHLSDIVEGGDIGWHVEHGQVNETVRLIRRIVEMDRPAILAKGQRAKQLVTALYSKKILCGAFCDVLEARQSGRNAPR